MQNHDSISRRRFVGTAALAGASLPLVSFTHWKQPKNYAPADKLSLHVFSKHLQFLDYEEMAKTAAEIGFDGIDLTVRPGGHVEPERVTEDLPKAVAAIKKQGLKADMMTSAVIDADNPTNQQVLKVASQQGIKYYRTNWLKYKDDKSFEENLKVYRKQVQKLSKMNKDLGLLGGYQNHSGLYVGAAIWDMWELLKDADTAGLGSQYDVCHGTIEGGRCWTQNLQLIQPHIKSIALKDFKWENENGEWKVNYAPIGEGMVDFKKYFQLLKQYNLNVPVSLHFEYPIGGAEHGGRENIDKNVVVSAMKKDVQMVHKLWQEA